VAAEPIPSQGAGIDPYHWYEVWAEDVSVPPGLAVLFGNREGTHFQIFSVIDNKIWWKCSSYEDACTELLEDEYHRVTGRMEIID
jgi:hypothetical protein